MRRFPLFLGPFVLVAAAAVACVAPDGSDEEEGPAVGADDQDLIALELACRGGGGTLRFDVSPGFGGTTLEGSFQEGVVKTAFVCRSAGVPDAGAGDASSSAKKDASASDAGAGAGELVATCTERPQSVHPGRYTVDVTKSAAGYTATLRRGTDAGADTTLACTTPPRPDAGAPAADGGAAPAPTYADVKPIIDRVCGRCHTGVFNSIPNIKMRRVQMLGAISSGSMPRGAGSTWRGTPDGQKVLDFLRNSPEIQ